MAIKILLYSGMNVNGGWRQYSSPPYLLCKRLFVELKEEVEQKLTPVVALHSMNLCIAMVTLGEIGKGQTM